MLEAEQLFDATAPTAEQQPQPAAEEEKSEAKKVYEHNLGQYRGIIAKLQEEFPNCLDEMPGFTAGELEERERTIVEDMCRVSYSKRYQDSKHEYRHVILPKGIVRWLPNPPRLMTEPEWRSLGVIQSPGWTHYLVHEPEPHVLLFRRDK